MDLKNLTALIQVVELGSFTRAAEKLGYSQPAVSSQIRQLEEELGVPLFDRINHTITLTSQGKEVLDAAYEICARLAKLKDEVIMDPQIRGKLRVAMSDSMCSWLLERQYSALREEYPAVQLQIITTNTNEEMLRLLDQNEVDLACTLDRHVYQSNYTIGAEIREKAHFITAAGDPLAMGAPISFTKLVEQPCILTEKNVSYRSIFEQQLARCSLEIDPVLELGNTDLICHLVEKGLGISLLPDYVTEQAVNDGRLVRLEVEGLDIEIWRQVLYHQSKYLSPLMKTVMKYLI